MFGFVYIGSKTIYSLRNYGFFGFLGFFGFFCFFGFFWFFVVFCGFLCLFDVFWCCLVFFIISNKNIKNTGGANASRDSLVDPASTHAPGEGAEMEVFMVDCDPGHPGVPGVEIFRPWGAFWCEAEWRPPPRSPPGSSQPGAENAKVGGRCENRGRLS